jgi:hypothetical protein
MVDDKSAELRCLRRFSGEEPSGVDDEQVEGFGAARYELERCIVEPAGQRR